MFTFGYFTDVYCIYGILSIAYSLVKNSILVCATIAATLGF
jgi:hypothetical protein